MIKDFLTFDLTPKIVNVVSKQMIVTVLQAFLATTLGAIIAVPFSFLAAEESNREEQAVHLVILPFPLDLQYSSLH